MNIEIPHPIESDSVPRDTWAPWLDRDTDKAVTLAEWWCIIDGVPHCVKSGYVTDWASIPWWVEWLYPADTKAFRNGALFHDHCYSHLWPLVSKKFADKAFREILKHDGVPIFRRWIFYAAVRVGGKGGWHKVKEANADPFWREQYARMVA